MIHMHDDTSAALVRAAHSILETAGPEALTVRRIAAEAGMSTMNVYSRFEGKHGVIDELYADGYRRLAAQLQAVPTTDRASDDIVAVMHAYRNFAHTNPTYYRIMFGTAAVPAFVPSARSQAIAATCLHSLRARVELGQARGELMAFDDWDPTEISAWLWATCHGLIALEASDIGVPGVAWGRIFQNGTRSAVQALQRARPSLAA